MAGGGARAVVPALGSGGNQAGLGPVGYSPTGGMAATSAPGSRGRSGAPPPSAGHPPSKRARGFPAAAAPAPEDPFGAHEDFTADDLEELDTLASQALSQCPAAARDAFSECASASPGPRRARGVRGFGAPRRPPRGGRAPTLLHLFK